VSQSPARQRALSDHKQIGKRFIPPFVAAMPITEVGWVKEILPELLWLALLEQQYGLERSPDIALALSNAALEVTDDKSRWFALCSSYAALSELQRDEVVARLRATRELGLLQQPLYPLIHYYPECPLSFLFDAASRERQVGGVSLATVKEAVATLFDRRSVLATRAQASGVYLAFVGGQLSVDKSVSLANFPEVANYPSTEESARIAAAVRAAVTMFVGERPADSSATWCRYFWNRGLEVESCEWADGEADD
jgi:hypothetical protein